MIFLRRILSKLRLLRKYVRDGGIVHVHVATIYQGAIFKGKNVLVTGGSSGIGLAIARKCLSEGASVVITGRNAQKLRKLCKEVRDPRFQSLVWDVSDISNVTDKLRETGDLFGGDIDIVFNNAGVYKDAKFLNVTEEVWDSVHDINLKALFFICQSISQFWIERKRCGKIVNIASIAGINPAIGPYWTSKWGVVGLTRGIGKRLCPNGIIVNAVAPGVIGETGMNRINATNNAYMDLPPSNRVGLPKEIAEVACFLASDAANHIVGQTIVCDGGNSLN